LLLAAFPAGLLLAGLLFLFAKVEIVSWVWTSLMSSLVHTFFAGGVVVVVEVVAFASAAIAVAG
jgi:hypothetical protein